MDNLKLNIAIAGNTWNPTLLAIQAKNYKITLYFVVDGDGNETSEYEARKNGRRFCATSPAELLGLIAMWEVRGDDWQYDRKTEPNLHEELAELSITYDLEGNIVEN